MFDDEYRSGFREVEKQAWWTLPRIAMFLVVLLVVLTAINFIGTGGDLALYKFWAPKYANAQRQVFENTQSYVQGKVEYLMRLRFQYQQAKEDKEDTRAAGLRTLILDEASTVDNDKLPPDLQAFISRLKE